MLDGNFSEHPFRSCGLGLAIGTALSYKLGEDIVPPFGAITITYIIGHVVRNGIQNRKGRFIASIIDTIIYDGLASALIPTVITFGACKITLLVATDFGGGNEIMTTWGPLLVGLAVLSLTTRKIDSVVHDIMNKTHAPSLIGEKHDRQCLHNLHDGAPLQEHACCRRQDVTEFQENNNNFASIDSAIQNEMSPSEINFPNYVLAHPPLENQNVTWSLAHWANTQLIRYASKTKEDIFRQTPVRLLGYGYAVTEAFHYRDRHYIGDKFCVLSGGFILVHCLVQAMGETEGGHMVIAFCDTFIWEALASVLIPSIIVNVSVSITDAFLEICCEESYRTRRWLPVFVGIAMLPLTMVAVDDFVDRLMDQTIRKLYA